ncbi:MAG TPA: PfkB family carbohydrate kinase [Vicinamibacterales bacterium]|nr:PfkB family carbohydrate kinase [Vicinamibacterales bacterium]
MDTSTARLLTLIERFRGRTIAVVGDLIADEFIYGRVARVSREAPVLILNYDATEILPGGAGNAARNVAALGGAAQTVGLAGRDEAGRRMLDALRASVDVTGVVRPQEWRTPTKTRILAGGIHSAKQQVVRIDRAAEQRHGREAREAVHARLTRALRKCDAVLLSDYGSGLVTPALAAAIRREVGPDRPVFVDSRYQLAKYRGITACTPNESEVEHLFGIVIGDDRRVLERAGRALLARLRARAVLVTRGSRGMALFEPDKPTEHISIFGSDEIADVTGAGDTVIATVALAVAAGATFPEAARLANYAGGIVVMKRGTATVSGAELRAAVAADRGKA